MKYCRVCYDGNTPVSFEVCWCNGVWSYYAPTEDILTMFDSLCDHLRGKGYFICFPSPCRWYEDSDFWSVVLVKE